MKSRILSKLLVLVLFILLLPIAGQARDISPIVSTDWLLANMKNSKLIILDVRRVEDYREGHIPGAFNMPTSCAFNADKTFKTKDELAAIAEAVIGIDRVVAIITYCDTGQCCPIWSYLLKQVLGYKNFRLYVGAMQEWAQDPGAPVTKNGNAADPKKAGKNEMV